MMFARDANGIRTLGRQGVRVAASAIVRDRAAGSGQHQSGERTGSGMNGKSAGRRAAARIRWAAALAMTGWVLAVGCWAAAAPAAAAPTAEPTASGPATSGPTVAAPFVYVANKGRNDVSQFGGALSGSGALRPLTPKVVASGPFPSATAVSPQGNSVYVVDTGPVSAPVAEVSQYSINPATGKLTPKSPATVAAGSGPSAMAVAPDGKNAYVAAEPANSSTGTISQYRISSATGKLTPLSPATVATPGSPDSGSIKVAPDGKNLYVANTKTDKVAQYRISPASGGLSSKPVSIVTTGSGPESVTIAPDGKSAYVTEPMAGLIAQYRISPATGRLTPDSPATVATGPGPHDLAVSPDSKNAYLLTVVSNTVSQYAINPATGALSSKPVSTAATVLHPEAIVIAPDGKNAYVTSENTDTLSQFAISPATGKITSLSPATVTTATSGSIGLAVTPAADLTAKVSAPATARHGSALTYTIKIRNAGPSQAWQARVTDHLPAGTAFRTATTASGHCSRPAGGTRGATVTCHLGALKAGATWRIRIKISVKAGTGTIRDQASITSVTPDPRRGNNTATASTRITT
jgi:6-phosphogluconolactonase